MYGYFAGSPTSSRGSSATSKSHVCWHVRLFLQLLTGTQVASRQNNLFSVRRLCTSLCDFPSLIRLTIFSRKCRGIRPRRNAAIAKTIWPSVQKAFKILPAFCFQKFSSDLLSKSFQKFSSDSLSKIFQRFAFKNFPAICFQNFASSLAFKKLSKIFQRFAFKKLSKFFQRLAFKNFPAICFQTFERSEMAKIWKLIAFKILLTKIR